MCMILVVVIAYNRVLYSSTKGVGFTSWVVLIVCTIFRHVGGNVLGRIAQVKDLSCGYHLVLVATFGSDWLLSSHKSDYVTSKAT